MIRLNLLRGAKSLRDTVRPDTPIPGGPPPLWRRPLVLYAIAIMAMAGGALWYLGAEVSVNVGEKSYTVIGESPHAPRPAERPAPVKPAERKAPAGKPEERSEPAAHPAAAPKSEEKKGWAVRFAVCVYRESCEKLAGRLEKRGIETFMEEDFAEITASRVTVGPFADGGAADTARNRLMEKGVGAGLTASGEGSYLSAGPFFGKEEAEKAARKMRSAGHEPRISTQKEKMRVYKLYNGSWREEKEARRKMAEYRKSGIECILEKR
ncbi:MAG: SPOR domain-containing protein [Candidatus Nitrospinota bacterium M3_3B_026]